jgi:putative hydrolase of HD superfamily
VNVADILEVLLHGNQLKRTARTGWVQRGVPEAENVAAHSYGVAYTTLILAQVIEEPLEVGKALALALLHDLPEGLTGDLPAPAARFLPDGAKGHMERAALQEIAGGTPLQESFEDWWEELEADESAEARLVHDADKLELFIQALVYEEQTGNRHLAEFWERPPSFHFAAAQGLYEALRERRGK